MTYALDLDLFYKLYEKENRDLRKTVVMVKALSRKKGDGKKNLEDLLSRP